ncbi:MAG: hypothetical protein AAGG02_09175 [Cyanobacteria bacterium P01_H01_bin.15]
MTTLSETGSDFAIATSEVSLAKTESCMLLILGLGTAQLGRLPASNQWQI